MSTTTATIDTQKLHNNLRIMDSLMKHMDFEYDDEAGEWCAFFRWINTYYWQAGSKNDAVINLLACYFDTKDL